MFNPFLYVDPSGYTWFSKLGNWFRNNWESIVTTVVTVAVGVAVGAAVVASCGTAAPLLVAVCAGTAAGFAGGVTSGILSGQDLGGVMKSGLIGAGTGLVSGALGGVASTFAPAGALWGSLYGAGTGSVIGGVGSAMTGGDIKEGIIFGAAAGLVSGGFQGYCSAKNQGLNPWTGKNLTKPAGRPSNLIADEGGSYSVYQGVNEDGEVKYIGITKRDPQVRWGEHLNSGTERAKLEYQLVSKNATGLSKTNAHIWEQNLINQYGLNNLYNKINSIEPRYWPQYNIQP